VAPRLVITNVCLTGQLSFQVTFFCSQCLTMYTCDTSPFSASRVELILPLV
jgi:hypothetical protein